ncbi:DUF6442 family protein [Kineothrix sp. MB12-C1]|uniref:DUF6442 family protein n=1 Tax=Kineothrix sp. MB12-C1 TaxID=3070215 RepID=UPI0027D31AF1|nr:DUF6442 family protein [Kineothrix sp. MB12-C1]WMC93348.1 DUF6442 family protein [Kineothrix sp. MB12-C1]
MKKEEILKMSRDERKDEGKLYIHAYGRKYGVWGMLFIFIILSVYHLYTETYEEIYSLLAVIFGYLSCESLGIFVITKRKTELFKIIIGTVVCITFLTLALQ